MTRFNMHRHQTHREVRRLMTGHRFMRMMHIALTSFPWRLNPKTLALGLVPLLLLSLTACGGEPVNDSVVCCKLPDGTISSETTSDCEESGGDQVEDELCSCDEDICCENSDGTFQTLPESQCENIAAPERCLDVSPTDEVCCKTPTGYVTLPANECPDGQSTTADMCVDEDVCCKTENGLETIPGSECPEGQEVAADMCIDNDEDVCCETPTGYVTLPASECPDGQSTTADMCVDEDVCCKTDNGLETIPSSECPMGQEVAADMCSDEDVCCALDDGTYETLPASQCGAVSPDPDLCLDEDVCCRLDGQFVSVPSSQCPTGQQAPTDMCVQDPDVCCRTADGFVTIPSSECPMAQEVTAEMCMDVCCETETGVQFVPAGQCNQAQVVSDDICAREVCCETADGYEFLPQASCPQLQISDALLCEEEVCCKTADGNAYVPASQCEPMSVIADDFCVTPDTECLKFRAVDMSALPFTTTAGDTLASLTSMFGTFSLQPGWSSSCLEVPMGAERAFVAVGRDLVLNFAAPISSLFLLRFNAQSGDDLIVPNANLTPTFCGASSYNNITRVDLTTPSTSVTIQDTDLGGGSGYSVLLAECIEWATN